MNRTGTKRSCVVCGKSFPFKGKTKFCSDKCRLKRHREQLAIAVERRSKASLPHRKKVCKICGESFIARTRLSVYCSKQECKDEGLRQAVKAQILRRLKDKGKWKKAKKKDQDVEG